MSRCLPLVIVLFLPIGFFMKTLYLWAKYSNPAEALRQHLITRDQAHAIAFKHPMLSIPSVWIQAAVLFAIWFIFTYLLNKWGLQRDADPHPNVRFWQVRLENISGIGVVIYSITMTAVRHRLGHVARRHLVLVDVWASCSWWARAYAVFALSIIADASSLSKAEPIKTLLRTTEQHDLGKLAFAFVMLNIYLAFSQFLIIWSGNLPEEIPWGPGPYSRQLGRHRRRWTSSSTGCCPSRCCSRPT